MVSPFFNGCVMNCFSVKVLISCIFLKSGSSLIMVDSSRYAVAAIRASATGILYLLLKSPALTATSSSIGSF